MTNVVSSTTPTCAFTAEPWTGEHAVMSEEEKLQPAEITREGNESREQIMIGPPILVGGVTSEGMILGSVYVEPPTEAPTGIHRVESSKRFEAVPWTGEHSPDAPVADKEEREVLVATSHETEPSHVTSTRLMVVDGLFNGNLVSAGLFDAPQKCESEPIHQGHEMVRLTTLKAAEPWSGEHAAEERIVEPENQEVREVLVASSNEHVEETKPRQPETTGNENQQNECPREPEQAKSAPLGNVNIQVQKRFEAESWSQKHTEDADGKTLEPDQKTHTKQAEQHGYQEVFPTFPQLLIEGIFNGVLVCGGVAKPHPPLFEQPGKEILENLCGQVNELLQSGLGNVAMTYERKRQEKHSTFTMHTEHTRENPQSGNDYNLLRNASPNLHTEVQNPVETKAEQTTTATTGQSPKPTGEQSRTQQPHQEQQPSIGSLQGLATDLLSQLQQQLQGLNSTESPLASISQHLDNTAGNVQVQYEAQRHRQSKVTTSSFQTSGLGSLAEKLPEDVRKKFEGMMGSRSQTAESSQENYTDEHGNLVTVARSTRRIVTTTKSMHSTGGQGTMETQPIFWAPKEPTAQRGLLESGHQIASGEQPLIRLKVNEDVFRGVVDEDKHIHLVPMLEKPAPNKP